MKTHFLISVFSFAAAAHLSAGPINIVHVGPRDVLKFEIDAAGDKLDFTLAHGANSGSFILPDKPSTLKGFIEEIPALEIPASAEPRIAVLAASGDAFNWRVFPAKPTPDKWSFRIINLSSEPATIGAGDEAVEIAAGAESERKVTGRSRIRVDIPDVLEAKYEGSEPCAVVAFLYRDGDEWKAVFMPDR